MSNVRKTVKELEQEKKDRIMLTVAKRAGYYRENPHRFANEVLFSKERFQLAWFQQILLWAMFHYNYFMYIAARGFAIYKKWPLSMGT